MGWMQLLYPCALVATIALVYTPTDDTDCSTLSGEVTLDGQPLEGAALMFELVDLEGGYGEEDLSALSVPAEGCTDAKGHYEARISHALEEGMVGIYDVSITHYGNRTSYGDGFVVTRRVSGGNSTLNFYLTSSGVELIEE